MPKEKHSISTKWILRFYNKISGLDLESCDDIPNDTFIFLTSYSSRDLKKGFLHEYLRKGKKLSEACIKFGLSERKARIDAQITGLKK